MKDPTETPTQERSPARIELFDFFDRLIIASRLDLKSRVRRLIDRSFTAGKIELREDPSGPKHGTTELLVPAQRDYLILPRLVVAGIGSRLSQTLEMIEKQKMALTEASENALAHAFGENAGSILYRYLVSPKELTIEVIDDGRGMTSGLIDENKNWVGGENGMGLFLMQSLVDRLEIESEPGEGTLVRLITVL